MSSDGERYGRAGDYVMGRMEPAERERAERDLERDPKFREAVLRLSERIRRHDGTANLELWRSVEAGLNSLPQMRAAASPPSSRAGPTKRRETARPHPLAGWKGALLVAGVAAACGASYVAGKARARAETPEMVVTLTDPGGAIGGILEIAGDDMLRFVPLALGGAAAGSSLRLWTIYDETIGFVPLGTLPVSGAARWSGPDLPPPRAGQRYRVTAGDDGSSAPMEPALFEGAALPVGEL
ncbi:MAG: anti-sigma factor domain-containing protein [Mesorhizobium sp.]